MRIENKILRRTLCAILAVIAVVFNAYEWYVSDYYLANDYAKEMLTSTDEVSVDEISGEDVIVFETKNSDTALIFYPGGLVEYTAYAPVCKKLAEKGITVILPKMPDNLAVLGINKAKDLRKYAPDATKWYIAGHSLGASMAAYYVDSEKDSFDGLILLAGYSTKDLSDDDIPILSIYGNCDQIMNRENYEKYKPNLGLKLTETVIEGLNHSLIGSYGWQMGDGKMLMTSEESAEKISEVIIEWMSL